MGQIGRADCRDGLFIQLSFDKAIRAGLLLAHLPYPNCEARMQNNRCHVHCVVYFHDCTRLGSVPTSEGILA